MHTSDLDWPSGEFAVRIAPSRLGHPAVSVAAWGTKIASKEAFGLAQTDELVPQGWMAILE